MHITTLWSRISFKMNTNWKWNTTYLNCQWVYKRNDYYYFEFYLPCTKNCVRPLLCSKKTNIYYKCDGTALQRIVRSHNFLKMMKTLLSVQLKIVANKMIITQTRKKSKPDLQTPVRPSHRVLATESRDARVVRAQMENLRNHLGLVLWDQYCSSNYICFLGSYL